MFDGVDAVGAKLQRMLAGHRCENSAPVVFRSAIRSRSPTAAGDSFRLSRHIDIRSLQVALLSVSSTHARKRERSFGQECGTESVRVISLAIAVCLIVDDHETGPDGRLFLFKR